MDKWAYERGVLRDFSRLGKPRDNDIFESFNRWLRQKCLNELWFMNLADAKEKRQLGEGLETRLGLKAQNSQKILLKLV
jgi:transposase InsO family protein